MNGWDKTTMNVKPDFSKNANQAATAPAFLSVWDMHAYYGESYIVQGVSFNVHEGEILALAGPQRRGQDLDPALHRAIGQPAGDPWRDLARPQPLHKMNITEAAAAGLGWCPRTGASSPA
jgi:branched-chain amino acid transport system ATP-binding protein